jgi:hypothetical protein
MQKRAKKMASDPNKVGPPVGAEDSGSPEIAKNQGRSEQLS